jgi:hypothetical protein
LSPTPSTVPPPVVTLSPLASPAVSAKCLETAFLYMKSHVHLITTWSLLG